MSHENSLDTYCIDPWPHLSELSCVSSRHSSRRTSANIALRLVWVSHSHASSEAIQNSAPVLNLGVFKYLEGLLEWGINPSRGISRTQSKAGKHRAGWRIREVLGLELCWDISYPDWDFSWPFSYHPGKCRDQNRFHPFVISMYQPNIRRYKSHLLRASWKKQRKTRTRRHRAQCSVDIRNCEERRPRSHCDCQKCVYVTNYVFLATRMWNVCPQVGDEIRDGLLEARWSCNDKAVQKEVQQYINWNITFTQSLQWLWFNCNWNHLCRNVDTGSYFSTRLYAEEVLNSEAHALPKHRPKYIMLRGVPLQKPALYIFTPEKISGLKNERLIKWSRIGM